MAPTDPAETAARLGFAVTRLHRQLRRLASDNLTVSLLSALVTIERCGPLGVGDLGHAEGVSPPTATRLVTALADMQLIERARHTGDRRSMRVAITDAGRRQLENLRRIGVGELAQRLGALEPGDLHRLVEALPALEALAEHPPRGRRVPCAK